MKIEIINMWATDDDELEVEDQATRIIHYVEDLG